MLLVVCSRDYKVRVASQADLWIKLLTSSTASSMSSLFFKIIDGSSLLLITSLKSNQFVCYVKWGRFFGDYCRAHCYRRMVWKQIEGLGNVRVTVRNTFYDKIIKQVRDLLASRCAPLMKMTLLEVVVSIDCNRLLPLGFYILESHNWFLSLWSPPEIILHPKVLKMQ